MKYRSTLLILLVAGCSAVDDPAPPSGDEPPRTGLSGAYLALGDSIAFGANPLVEDKADPRKFLSYASVLAATADLDLVNASCGGETTGSFLSLDAEDNGCKEYRAEFPLHVSYASSQLEFAIAHLHDHPETSLITLNLASNDLLLLDEACAGDVVCQLDAFGPVLETIRHNYETLFGRIRQETNYRGAFVVLTPYAADYRNTVQLYGVQQVGRVIAEVTHANRGLVANGMAAFGEIAAAHERDACAAGLLIPLPEGGCDKHPSMMGHEVLAAAILDTLAYGEAR